MIEILPSINSESWNEVQSRVHKIEATGDWVEIDICDATLSKRKTWNNPDDLKSLQAPATLRIAAHLLVAHPEKYVDQWIHAGVRRIIVQWEGIRVHGFARLFGRGAERKAVQFIKDLCVNNWVEFGISIAPGSPVHEIEPYLELCDIVQVLAVPIGLSGGHSDQESLCKAHELASLREKYHYKVEWDGGVNLNTIQDIVKTKTDIAVSTSFVFNAPDPNQALEALRRQVLL